MAKKIFVTGGTGLVGSYLLRYLVQSGYTEIRALKRATSKFDLVQPIADKIEWIEGDVLDVPVLEDAMEGMDWVFHCAAMVSFRRRDRKQLYAVNQEGTANMVNVALYRGIEKFCQVSSIAAFGKNQKEVPISEDNKWQRDPINSDYTISKYLAEQEVWRGIAEGLPAVIVNPSVIMGSAFWQAGPARFFTQVYEGLKFYPTGGTGFVDVRDVTRFMIQLMESSVLYERYVLSGENWSYRAIFDAIADSLNVKRPNIQVTHWMKELAWRISGIYAFLTGKQPMVTRATAHASMASYQFDNTKSRRVFDFEYTPILETIQQSGKQFLEGRKEGLRGQFLELN